MCACFLLNNYASVHNSEAEFRNIRASSRTRLFIKYTRGIPMVCCKSRRLSFNQRKWNKYRKVTQHFYALQKKEGERALIELFFFSFAFIIICILCTRTSVLCVIREIHPVSANTQTYSHTYFLLSNSTICLPLVLLQKCMQACNYAHGLHMYTKTHQTQIVFINVHLPLRDAAIQTSLLYIIYIIILN